MSDSRALCPRIVAQDRRRIATEALADATGIAFGLPRRPASALSHAREHDRAESII